MKTTSLFVGVALLLLVSSQHAIGSVAIFVGHAIEQGHVKSGDWFSAVRSLVTDVASTISFIMLVSWALWREFNHLFRKNKNKN